MPTNWTTITLQMLGSYLEAELVTTLNTKDLLAGQSDRFTQAMTDITNKVRSVIQAPPRLMAVSATANAVAPELVGDVCKLILAAMQASCPAIVLEKDQVSALNKSWKMFEPEGPIAKGIFPLTMPSDPQPAGGMQGLPAPASVVHVNDHHRQCTMRRFHGL